MSYNFRNLIFPRVKGTKTTNRVISSFDRFTDYYNRKGKKFKKFLTPYVDITQVSRIVFLNSFDRFTNFTTVRGKNFKNLINP